MQPLQITSIITVVNCANKFLLVQRVDKDGIFPGKWQNPGGKIELGENVEAAIERELKEETGLELKSKPIFIKSYSWKRENKRTCRN